MSIRHSLLRLFSFTSITLLMACSPPEDASTTDAPVEKPITGTSAAKWPQITMPIAYDPVTEERIREILSKMSLEQKVGQMMQPATGYISPEQVTQYYIGSVLSGGGMYPNGERHANHLDWLKLADAYYDASMNMPEGVPAIPIIWGIDAVHGHNNVVGATLFPHNSALGATGNADLVKQIAESTAREMTATGLDWNFAPTVAVAKNLRWGRAYESYSENPGIVAQLGAAYTVGLQGDPHSETFLRHERVIATAKHFIGDGGTTRGDDQGDTKLSERELIQHHASGYFSALAAGAQTVMASYSSWQGTPLHGHQYLLTDVLKKQMGFDGFVVSDWNATGHVAGCSRDSCATAINAGVDMLMVPASPDWQNMIVNIIKHVKADEIPQARIDDAVSRILRVKIRARLFNKGKPSSRTAYRNGTYLSNGAHRYIARQAVRESLVLLKNNNALLPLSPKANILVTGNAANSVAMQSGGWTISWQGTDTEAKDFPVATTIYQAIANAAASSGGSVSLSENGAYTNKPDVALVVFGEEPYAEMRGDIQNLQTLEYSRQYGEALATLKKLKAQGIPTVSVFVSGRPRVVTKELNQSDAFVMAWWPGSEAAGISDMLLLDEKGQSRYDFRGRLSFAWPAQPCPNENSNNLKPLFPFGYGLDYNSSDDIGLLDERYAPFTNGCDLPETLGEVKTYAVKGPEWKMHLELKSLESVAVADQMEWQGIKAAIERSDNGDIKQFDIAWNAAPRNNVVIQDGKTHSLVPNLTKAHALQFDINITVPATEKVWVKMECGHLCSEQIEITEQLKSLPQNQWQRVYLPLSCVANARTDLAKINSLFRLDSSGDFTLSLRDITVARVNRKDAINICPKDS